MKQKDHNIDLIPKTTTPPAGRLAKGTAVVALGFVSAMGLTGLAEADVRRVENDIATLRAAADTGAKVSHPILDAVIPMSDAMRQICHSNSYSQSAGHNQGHGQTYSC